MGSSPWRPRAAFQRRALAQLDLHANIFGMAMTDTSPEARAKQDEILRAVCDEVHRKHGRITAKQLVTSINKV
jgi:hypothetical protein